MSQIVDPRFASIFVFCVAVLLSIFFESRKNMVVWGCAAALIALGVISPSQALSSLDLGILALYAGMMLIGGAILYSKMPEYIAFGLASRLRSARVAMLAIVVLSGMVSMFVMNIAAVLILAPVAISVCRKCNIDPVPVFIGMVLMINLEGCATLIGDPPSMLLGAVSGIGFSDFFFVGGAPSMFFAVQAAAIASLPILWLYFRGYDHPLLCVSRERYMSAVPSFLALILVLCLAAESIAYPQVPHLAGLTCLAFGLASFAWYLWHSQGMDATGFLKRLDWHTGAYLAGVLILVGSLTSSGVVEDIAAAIVRATGADLMRTYIILLGISLAGSAFVLNIPYIAFMLPVTEMVAWRMSADSHALLFGLLLAGSLGGNITLLGASANIVAFGILRDHGRGILPLEFMRVGLPFALVSTAVGGAFLWFALT